MIWNHQATQRPDWVAGDALGIPFPAHAAALLRGGPSFLTEAFRLSGALAANNAVTDIIESSVIDGGSTGAKLRLRVRYAQPDSYLHTDLFVKFSRAFDDPVRDAARVQMALEVKLALLSLDPNFPIVVPKCYYSDFHQQTGTGLLITQCIPYGEGRIERQYAKCLDYQLPDPLGHYRAIIVALARLAGAHKAGLLPDTVEHYFPFEPDRLVVSTRQPLTPDDVRVRLERYTQFVQHYPQLVPDCLRSEQFLQRLPSEGPRLQALGNRIKALLQDQPAMIALCHWNAHIDNAWFWRSEDGVLNCGLMDWGNVSQMNVAMAIWGCLSAAEPTLWTHHLDELFALFIDEFARVSGSHLDIETLRLHLVAYVLMMGLNWMLDVPATLQQKIPDLDHVADRFDQRIQADERSRSQLLIFIVFMQLWAQTDTAPLFAALEQQR